MQRIYHSLGDWGSRVQISALRPATFCNPIGKSSLLAGGVPPVCKAFADLFRQWFFGRVPQSQTNCATDHRLVTIWSPPKEAVALL